MSHLEQYFSANPVHLSNNEIFSEIKLYESTVEMIGYVDMLCDIEIVGKDNKKVFKFFLNNGSGVRIQVKAWKEQVDRVVPHIRANHIIHLDGAASRPVHSNFNNGTVPFELIIQSNTKINCFGKFSSPQLLHPEISELPLTDFDNLGHATGIICIQGFIKTSFMKVRNERTESFKHLLGSIANGTFKLEIHVNQVTDTIDFQKGEKVEVKGVIHFEGTTFLQVKSIEDIIKIPGEEMSFTDLLKASETIKRILKEENDLNQTKKVKVN